MLKSRGNYKVFAVMLAFVVALFSALILILPYGEVVIPVVGDHLNRKPTGRGFEIVLLNEVLVISQDDLEWYSWKSHTMKLKKSRDLRIPRSAPGTVESGWQYSVRVDGQPCYSGHLLYRRSTHRDVETYIVYHELQNSDYTRRQLVVSLGEGAVDRRDNPLIRKALAAAGLSE
jgi:hypothetical protein